MAQNPATQKKNAQTTPTWWQRYGEIFKFTLGTLTFITPFVVGAAYLYIDSRVESKLAPVGEKNDSKLKPLMEKLDNLGQRISNIEGQISTLMILRAAAEPKKAANARRTSEILTTAKKSGSRIDPDVILASGKQFIEAGSRSRDPAVWNAALTFLNYRSFLNAPLAPSTEKFSQIEKEKIDWILRYNFKVPGAVPTKPWYVRTGDKVTAEKAAVMENIGEHPNANKPFGFEYVLISDFDLGFVLDGMRLRNVIFRNTKIIYSGGPLEMQNVYFVDCSFDVSNRPNGDKFANSVLVSAPATTFQTRG